MSISRRVKKTIGIAVVVVVVLSLAAWRLGGPLRAAYLERSLRRQAASDARTRADFQKLLDAEKYRDTHPDDPQGFISTGLVWKTFGEATGDRRFFERSRREFARGAELFGDRNTVILIDAGNMERQLGNFLRAEEYYSHAARVNPGQADSYLALVDLYRYNLAKERGDKAVIDTYRRALASVYQNAEVVHSLAFYLKDMKRYKDALPYFQLLQKAFDNDPQYSWEVKFVKEAIDRGEDKSTGAHP